jgi:hypothetical protein
MKELVENDQTVKTQLEEGHMIKEEVARQGALTEHVGSDQV